MTMAVGFAVPFLLVDRSATVRYDHAVKEQTMSEWPAVMA